MELDPNRYTIESGIVVEKNYDSALHRLARDGYQTWLYKTMASLRVADEEWEKNSRGISKNIELGKVAIIPQESGPTTLD